jgi:hypothetical protein
VTFRTVLPQLGRVGERHVVQLDVLPGGDVAFVQRHPAFDRDGEGFHLLGRDAAERQLHPDHLHVGLALSVDALFEPEGDEGVLALVAGQEATRLAAEIVELVGEDRDHLAGDVLVDLRVLPRTGHTLAGLVLAAVDVEALEDLVRSPGGGRSDLHLPTPPRASRAGFKLRSRAGFHSRSVKIANPGRD